MTPPSRPSATLLERDKPWHGERLSLLYERVCVRLGGPGLLDEYPNLCAYVARAETRPACKRAFDAQLAVFTASRPNG